MPQNAAGTRIEPLVSEASASGTVPAATAAAEPPDEPPQVRRGSNGLPVAPNSRFTVLAPMLNSGMLVLPRMMPPAARIAAALGAPLVWLASFGWDAIYAPLGGGLAERAQACLDLYGQGDLLLRCPLALPMPWGIPELPLGLTCSRPRFDSQELAGLLGLPPERERCVLISFGGLGLELDPALLARWPDHVFLGSGPALASAPNGRLLPSHVRPLDAMPLVGRLITKAGYSSFCEAFSQEVGIHLVERHGFAEAPVLEQALRDHGSHRLLRRDQLLTGDWQLDQPLLPPWLGTLPADGALVAARALVALAES